MKDDKDAALKRAAESVADGVPFAWDEESEGRAEIKEKLRLLKLLKNISEVHRPTGATEQSLSKEISDRTTVNAERRPAPLFRWGHLEVIELIGHGGFGNVYRAFDTTLHKDVALKLLRNEDGPDEARQKRFLAEARRLARIRHENVLVVHGAAEHDGRVGLWTDLIEGKTLEELIEESGTFGSREAMGAGIELCRALAAVHGKGLIHRDVKNSNVVREKGGRYVLLDFSSATDVSPLKSGPGSGSVSGTPLYMAPELFRGEDAGAAGDIYSLGVVLYRLVSGRYPVEAKTLSELRDKHRRGESTPLLDVRADLSSPLVGVIEKALDRDPERRFPSVGEMERALHGESSPRPTWLKLVLTTAAVVLLGILLLQFVPSSPLQVEASLYRTGSEVEERLLPGGRVLPGDLLFLEIEGSHPMHVYVMNEDTQGTSTVLFPLPDLAVQNPLPPGTRHQLPGLLEGVPQRWEVTTAGGEETFIVIASLERLVDMEHEVEKIPRADSEAGIQLNEDSIAALRGIGGLKPSPESRDVTQRALTGIFATLADEAARKSGLWVWEIHLENPGIPRTPEP